MQAERDHLVRFVFPRLRAELLRRRIHLVDVDLRWGVTADQAALDLCLSEIDRCRPRFLCIMGGRYGQIPPPDSISKPVMKDLFEGKSPAGELPPAHLEALQDLYVDAGRDVWRLRGRPREKEALSKWMKLVAVVTEVLQAADVPDAARSITAWEVWHGALRDEVLETPHFRYFYFRDPSVTNSIPTDHAEDYLEPAGSVGEAALARLKQSIKTARGCVPVSPDRAVVADIPCFEYPCRWDPVTKRLVDLREFGDRVYRDLLASVDAEIGGVRQEAPDRLQEEQAAADTFIETCVERYTVGSRKPVLEAVHRHAEGVGGNGYLCLVGEGGSGKSALLARFYRDYLNGRRGDSPKREPQQGKVTIAHFVGVNASNVRELLRRLCEELARLADIRRDIPADYEELRKAFPRFLEEAASVSHVVIAIDAVDQLDRTHSGMSMTWLPSQLPAEARILLSAVPGPAFDALLARAEPPELERLDSLTEGDANSIIDGFCTRFSKALDTEQRDALLAKAAAGNPLYLSTALEELRTLGTYAEITGRIQQIPGDVQQLFLWILRRLEQDDVFRDEGGNRVGPDLVGPYCSCIAIGRSGMAESELAQLVAPADDPSGKPADHLGNVAAMQQLLRPYLMRRGELLDFFHSQLREAVESKYLSDSDEVLAAHRFVAEYFRTQADPDGDRVWRGSARAWSELPYHLTMAAPGDPVLQAELQDTLTDFSFLERKATDVGVEETVDLEGNITRTHSGVFQLQEDYALALEMFGSVEPEERKRRLIVTGIETTLGLKVRCSHCNQASMLASECRGSDVDCPQCNGPLRLNAGALVM